MALADYFEVTHHASEALIMLGFSSFLKTCSSIDLLLLMLRGCFLPATVLPAVTTAATTAAGDGDSDGDGDGNSADDRDASLPMAIDGMIILT